MAIYKCKMCGGDLHPQEGTKLITCEYCGTTQTVCQIDDSRIANLFNRANEQRLLNEFDKAEALYETIIIENPEESEAYWGKCLCKYGIEYVDDASGRKIPTCHRTIYKSIFDDPDYNRALKNADPISYKQYHIEAQEIDDIQRRIVEVASKEEPYDVFICYKETDEKGDRTPDSMYAQQIYDALSDKGLRVFFSRISLESKLGVDFEPYIFSALQSSRVMVVVGTKSEYLDSVWVKNEWNRFLKLCETDKNKTIIPCYASMSPSQLPNEFAFLQGQDLTKIGAIQDITRGVQKILDNKPVEKNFESSISTKKQSKTKKTIIFSAVGLAVVCCIVVFVLLIKNTSVNKIEDETYNSYIAEDGTEYKIDSTKFRVAEVSSGIPSCEEYDIFTVQLDRENVGDYFCFEDHNVNIYDEFGDKIDDGVATVLKSKALDKGWYVISTENFVNFMPDEYKSDYKVETIFRPKNHQGGETDAIFSYVNMCRVSSSEYAAKHSSADALGFYKVDGQVTFVSKNIVDVIVKEAETKGGCHSYIRFKVNKSELYRNALPYPEELGIFY